MQRKRHRSKITSPTELEESKLCYKEMYLLHLSVGRGAMIGQYHGLYFTALPLNSLFCFTWNLPSLFKPRDVTHFLLTSFTDLANSVSKISILIKLEFV